MPIRNYTSTVSPAKSAGKIQQILSEHGARRVSIAYDGDRKAAAVAFQMQVEGRPIWFRIEPDPRGMLEALKEDDGVPNAKCNLDQAKRTAWKNELEWLDAQFAKIAANQARLEQLLIGYAVTETGETVWQQIARGGHLLEESGATTLPEAEIVEEGH